MLVISEAAEGEITLSATTTEKLQVIITDRAAKKNVPKNDQIREKCGQRFCGFLWTRDFVRGIVVAIICNAALLLMHYV